MQYVLGLDLGTSSLKGLLIDKTGHVAATAQAEYPLHTPAPGFSEQDPQLWISAAGDVITQIVALVPQAKSSIAGVSFSGQMHSLVLLDGQDKPLRNAILWNDVRTSAECAQITSKLGPKLLQITKNRALEGFTLPKILWVMQNEPQIWQKARTFMLPKDYLGFYLTGNKQMEFSDAAGTLMLDVQKRAWSVEICAAFGIDESVLPKLVNSTDKIGVIKKDIAQSLGLEGEIPVYAGGADNACAAAGAGILDESTAMCSIGTSGVFLAYEGAEVKDYKGKLHFFNHIIKDAYYSMGVTLSAGSSLSWFRDTFAKGLGFDELLKDIPQAGAGSGGLLFTPYITGERTPYADSQVRGSFVGIDIRHTRAHFARAVMEGITFSLKDSMELMRQYAGKEFKKIISVGGGAKNEHWLQMQADIFDCEVQTLNSEQGPSLGAAMTAAVGAGWYPDYAPCAADFVGFAKTFKPGPDAAKYKEVYAKYQQIYAATSPICKQ